MFVKFILNTAVDPHFCALFDERGTRLFYRTWENRRDDGKEIWQFLQQHTLSEITFLGGVSGPGGFSSLRAGAGILNSLAFCLHLPIASLRADFWQEALLGNTGEVVLNSFGDGVWLRKGKELERFSVEEACGLMGEKAVCVNWLPEEKAQKFTNPRSISMDNAPEELLHLLESTETHSQFITDYEVPPV